MSEASATTINHSITADGSTAILKLIPKTGVTSAAEVNINANLSFTNSAKFFSNVPFTLKSGHTMSFSGSTSSSSGTVVIDP
ncbi:MAG: hypothetical protein IJ599_02105 [Alphaproteobacteria bacterium]|nr:hypothetical protein [Alphaproteobacteria bacterium]